MTAPDTTPAVRIVQVEPTPLPIDLAPRDGTLLRLRVRYEANSDKSWTPLDDAEESWTVGFNNADNTEEDRWRVVGWCWSHGHLVEAADDVEVLGWLPFHGEQTLAAAPVAPAGEDDEWSGLERLADAATQGQWISDFAEGDYAVARDEDGGILAYILSSDYDGDNAAGDAAFIAAANPATIKRMIAALRARSEPEAGAVATCSVCQGRGTVRVTGAPAGDVTVSCPAGCPAPSDPSATERMRAALERFSAALSELPDVADRIDNLGQQVNAYDLSDEEGRKAVCVGPITGRPLSLCEASSDVADLIEAAFRVVREARAALGEA